MDRFPLTPWLLRAVNQRYRSSATEALADSGYADMPQPGFWALTALAQDTNDASGLVQRMGITKQAVSKLVDTLVERGYVDRAAHAEDRRRVQLALTERGRRAAELIIAEVLRAESAMAAMLEPGDLDRLRSMLSHMLSGTGVDERFDEVEVSACDCVLERRDPAGGRVDVEAEVGNQPDRVDPAGLRRPQR